jgi:hypothetical protein
VAGFVQEITITGQRDDVPFDYHYWEAWHVFPGAYGPDEHRYAGYDDQWSIRDDPSSAKGSIRYAGSAQFYEGESLPPQFGQGFDPRSGDLSSTTRNPGLPSYGATFPVLRFWRISWP